MDALSETPAWRRRRTALTIAVLTVAALIVVFASSTQPPLPVPVPVHCDLVAASTGSDGADGAAATPFRTAAKLVAALTPGETGCLRAGTYYEDVKISRAGRPGAPIILRGYPNERATVAGRLWVARGADYVTVSDLVLDGEPTHGVNKSRLPSPTVNAAHDTFLRDEVTNHHTAICFVLGSDVYGRARSTAIRDSRIHDCGVLPRANRDHGIYVANADDTLISGNWIYANADRGVQLFPDAQRTTIDGNVIASNGEGVIFSGEGNVVSNGNIVRRNLITGSSARSNIESFYPPGTAPGTGNVVAGNCVFGASEFAATGGIDSSSGGFDTHDNRVADPRYVDAAGHDYRLRPGSPCADLAVAPPSTPG